MSLFEIFKESVSRPLEEPKQLLIGTLLFMAFFFIVPIFTLYGYIMNVVRNVARDEPLPEFENYGDLTVDGLKLILVGMPVMVASYLAYFALVFGGQESTALIATSGLAYVLSAYFGFSIMLSYMVERDWRQAYSMESIRMTLNLEYVKYLLAYFVAYNVVAIAAGILVVFSFITIIGWLLVIPLATFYMMVFAGIFMGWIYRDLEDRRSN